jgi:hypothetical protein
MFGKHMLKQLAGGIAITASIAVVAVPTAFSSTSSRSGLLNDTLAGNRARPTQVQGLRLITDTLGGNGHAARGASPSDTKAIQDLGSGRTAAPSVTGGSGGFNFSWSDGGIGAGIAAGLLLLLVAGTRLRTYRRRGVLTV